MVLPPGLFTRSIDDLLLSVKQPGEGGVPERVLGYIDGFNLFGGLKDSGWTRYLWYDPSRSLMTVSPATHFVIGRSKLAASQLPEEVVKPDGTRLQRPQNWF